MYFLDEQLLNFDFHAINGALQLRSFVGGDGTANHGTTHPTGATQCYFAV